MNRAIKQMGLLADTQYSSIFDLLIDRSFACSLAAACTCIINTLGREEIKEREGYCVFD